MKIFDHFWPQAVKFKYIYTILDAGSHSYIFVHPSMQTRINPCFHVYKRRTGVMGDHFPAFSGLPINIGRVN